MVHLEAITQQNWKEAASLSVSREQQGFLDSATGIIARGYVYRECSARVYAIMHGGTVIGIALIRNLDESPACYDLQQMLIDKRYQHMGYGGQALTLIISRLRAEGKYPRIDVCVHKTNDAALRLFQKAGFQDTGYIDDQAPDCLNLTYSFSAGE